MAVPVFLGRISRFEHHSRTRLAPYHPLGRRRR